VSSTLRPVPAPLQQPPIVFFTSSGAYLDLRCNVLALLHRDEVGASDNGRHVVVIQQGDLQHSGAHQVASILGLEVGVVDGASLPVQQAPVLHQHCPGCGIHREGFTATAHMESSPGLSPGGPSPGQCPGGGWLCPYVHALWEQLVGDLAQDTAVRIVGLKQRERSIWSIHLSTQGNDESGAPAASSEHPKMWPC